MNFAMQSSLVILLVLVCLYICGCNFESRSRRLLIEIESLPLGESLPEVQQEVPKPIIVYASVATQQIEIVEPSRHKHSKSRKKSKRRGNR